MVKKLVRHSVCGISLGLLPVLAGCGSSGGGPSVINTVTHTQQALTATNDAHRAEVAAQSVQRFRGFFSRVATNTRQQQMSGFDSSTGLYFVTTVNADGSASVAYFTDAAHSIPAGSVQFSAPVQNSSGGLSETITINSFQGTNGSVTIAATDSTGNFVSLTLNLSTTQGTFTQTVRGTFDVAPSNPGSGSLTVADSSGSITINFQLNASGDTSGNLSDSGGDTGPFLFHADGSGTLTLNDSSGNLILTESFDSTGKATVTFADGSIQTIP